MVDPYEYESCLTSIFFPMKTTQATYRNLSTRYTKNYCIKKLEKNYKALQEMERQFSSYIYEPNTYSLFTKLETIRTSLSNLKKGNAELLANLQKKKALKIQQIHKTKEQIYSFMELKKLFDDYTKQLRY